MKFILEERFILTEAPGDELTDLDVEDNVENTLEGPKARSVIKKGDQIDFAAMYKACSNAQDFEWFWLGDKSLPVEGQDYYQGYYVEEWQDNAAVVKKLGKVFTDDLLALGWTATTNPLVAFLHNYFRIRGAASFTPSAYIILHNAAADRKITTANLIGKEEKEAHLINIIYNPELYKDLGDAPKYLEIQSLIYQKKGQHPLISDEAAARNVALNILLANGNTENLKAEPPPASLVLREIRECTQLYKENFGELETQRSADISYVAQIINKLSKTEAKKVLAGSYYLLKLANAKAVKQANLDNKNKIVPFIKDCSLTPSDLEQISKLFDFEHTKYDVIDLLTQLYKKAST